MSVVISVSSLEDKWLEQIIDKMGEMWVSRTENKRSKGWWVKVEDRETRYAAHFISDDIYGNREQAKEAAIEWRDDFIRDKKLVPSGLSVATPKRRYKNKKASNKEESLSGIRGVWFSFASNGKDKSYSYPRWVAEGINGAQYYSVNEHGFTKAYEEALKARLEYLCQTNEIKNYSCPKQIELEAYMTKKYGETWRERTNNNDNWWK